MNRVKFWVNLALVMATSYVMIWYVFRPSQNQCQMTFMMEPPRFIPVPFDDTKSSKEEPSGDDEYRLFMYSELGFPSNSNIERDLKDSVPVLFVTGNAGSYQQVRSIASTSIRFQINSLDAAKFIFYTIDFRGQLSGISGQLIERQIEFVQKSIEKILSLYPSHTDGLILIGHSVGSFISKALFRMPNFDPKTVPILISLAGPLTNPYLNFDSQIHQLYRSTNEFWSRRSDDNRDTLALSISGGKSDCLVPTHLSMDETFDIALTTNTIRDVWVTTDHVSITWCRELIHKLSKLLSSLIDQKTSRLIIEKQDAIAIIKKQLLSTTRNTEKSDYKTESSYKDWKIARDLEILKLDNEFYAATRSQLGDKVLFIELGNILPNYRYLIYIKHIGLLKENGIYGCKDVNSTQSGHASCLSRTRLSHLALSIPSRQFEPKTTLLLLHPSDMQLSKYVVFDFSNPSFKRVGTNSVAELIPESISIQSIDTTTEHTLYVPTIGEFLFQRLFNSFTEIIKVDKTASMVYTKYRLINLTRKNQMFIIKFESSNCKETEGPGEMRILFYKSNILIESFHPTTKPNTFQIDVKISSEKSLWIKGEEQDIETAHLEFYIDGTCQNSIKLELNLLDIAINLIQKNLDVILATVTYLSYASIVIGIMDIKTSGQANGSSFYDNLKFAGFLLIYLLIRSESFLQNKIVSFEHIVDEFTELVALCILSYGSLAVLQFIVRRLFDLAIIATRLQRIVFSGVFKKPADATEVSNGTSSTVRCHNSDSVNWIIVGASIAGSLVLSSLNISLAQLYLLIRFKLIMSVLNKNNDLQITEKAQLMHSLLVNVCVLVGLSLISNIPAALLIIWQSLSQPAGILPEVCNVDLFWMISASSLLLINKIIKHLTCSEGEAIQNNSKSLPYLIRYLSQSMHVVALGSILTLTSDIRHINSALASTLIWLYFSSFDLMQALDTTASKQRRVVSGGSNSNNN